MMDLSVEVKGGEIHVVQANHPEEDSLVVLHPDQVEIVTKWLEEARGASKAEGPNDLAGLISAVSEFLSMFELVFDQDWEFSRMNLEDENRDLYIRPGATFIAPGVGDESNNWANRGSLLSAYRALLSKLEEEGIPIEHYGQ